MLIRQNKKCVLMTHLKDANRLLKTKNSASWMNPTVLL